MRDVQKGKTCKMLQQCIDETHEKNCKDREFGKGRDIMPIVRGVLADFKMGKLGLFSRYSSGAKLIGLLLEVGTLTVVSTLLQTAQRSAVAAGKVMKRITRLNGLLNADKCSDLTLANGLKPTDLTLFEDRGLLFERNRAVDRKNCRVCVRTMAKPYAERCL